MLKFLRNPIVLALLLVLPVVLLVAAPNSALAWLQSGALGIGGALWLLLVQRGVARLARGQLRREIGLGALLQPLAAVALVSSIMLGGVLLKGISAAPEAIAATPTPLLDPLSEGYRPFTLAADLVELGMGGLAAFGIWALMACGISVMALLFALLYPALQHWLARRA